MLKVKLFAAFLPLLLAAKTMDTGVLSSKLLSMVEQQKIADSTKDFSRWVSVSQMKGGCYCSFPRAPDHMNQRLPMGEPGKELIYDVYIADFDRKEVFMVLVAEYPGKVDEKYEVMTLENLLNSILSQSSNNRLIFADLIEVQGRKGMDFFIESKNVYFKGRAVMNDKYLHLVAMECEKANYQEAHFDYFIGEFGFMSSVKK